MTDSSKTLPVVHRAGRPSADASVQRPGARLGPAYPLHGVASLGGRTLAPAPAPRSYDELLGTIRKAGDWFDEGARRMRDPLWVIGELAQLGKAAQLPREALPRMAVLVVQEYVRRGYAQLPPDFRAAAETRLGPDDFEDVSLMMDHLESSVQSLGPVAEWGRRADGLSPAPAESAEALRATLEHAHTMVAVQRAVRQLRVETDERDRQASPPGRGSDGTSPRSTYASDLLDAAVARLAQQATTAIAYQQLCDRLVCDPDADTRYEAAGKMLVELSLRVRDEREKHVAISTRDALSRIAAVDLPKVPQPAGIGALLRNHGKSVSEVLGNAPGLSPDAGATGGFLSVLGAVAESVDGKRIERATHPQEQAAVLLLNAFDRAEARVGVAPRERDLLPHDEVTDFLRAVEDAWLAGSGTGAEELEMLATSPDFATQPRQVVEEYRRDREAYHAVDDYLQIVNAQRSGAPLPQASQPLLAAAIGVVAARRGVSLGASEDDLLENRLPGIRGYVYGPAAQWAQDRRWEMRHHLSAEQRQWVTGALRRAEQERIYLHDLATEPVPLRPAKAPLSAGRGARLPNEVNIVEGPLELPLGPAPESKAEEDGFVMHRSPLTGGWLSEMVRVYAEQFSYGAVYAKSHQQDRTNEYSIPFAKLEPFQVLGDLLPPGARRALAEPTARIVRAPAEGPLEEAQAEALVLGTVTDVDGATRPTYHISMNQTEPLGPTFYVGGGMPTALASALTHAGVGESQTPGAPTTSLPLTKSTLRQDIARRHGRR